ncbi:HEAT repeat domain-containing protein [Actinomadura barringtoniae]|uniref:HEAT repeat domain-containing protein n=1 Tax=Actinomadura barringtoniae TaxID=1427535 RepID=A0A939PK99_9ACTN|nr:HEAT repeat domain-containing protein [Actinomadura barringtoniae]MBO2450121.1 HEAT repeat domain-containing protein [Actinomadura barringtoniae]
MSTDGIPGPVVSIVEDGRVPDSAVPLGGRRGPVSLAHAAARFRPDARALVQRWQTAEGCWGDQRLQIVLQAVALMRDRKAVDDLLTLLRGEPAPSTRALVLAALGAFDHLGPVPARVYADVEDRLTAESEDTTVRSAAAQCLGQFGSPAAIGPLLNATESPDPALRGGAITALGDLASSADLGPDDLRTVVEALAGMLAVETDEGLALDLVGALGRLARKGQPDALAALREVNDRNRAVLRAARYFLPPAEKP